MTKPTASTDLKGMYVTNPAHGGKVGCHKCHLFIEEGDCVVYGEYDVIEAGGEPVAWFHKKCFNRYEHYYGLDKPID